MLNEKRGRTILVVEDERDIRETIKETLEDEGYRVVTATNGFEALQKMRQDLKPCLVLLDLVMPVMTGVELLAELHGDVNLACTPILVISSAATEENTKGAIGYFKKPADLDLVLKVVNRFCAGA